MVLSVRITLAIVTGCVVALCLGVVIGYFAKPSGWTTPPSGDEEQLVMKIQNGIDTDNIKEFHSFFAKEPHIAGKAREHELAEYIRDTWRQQGLDHAELASYKVLLTYPDKKRRNKVSIVDENGEELFLSQRREKAYYPFENHTDAVDPFIAFSPAGEVTGELVYVNYGRAEDFLQLASLGVNVKGKIAIVKYGKIFRGNKVIEAEKAGALGLIIYSDPADYAKNGSDVYPDSPWLPPEGVQRGTIINEKGDQQTPGYPSTEHAYRVSGQELSKVLPKIPCQPIGYGDAEQLLRHLDGDDAPSEWQGGIKNIRPYKLGPGYKGSHKKSKVRLEVYNKFEQVTIHNVIGKIYDVTEPDRYVLLGNHRDAWIFGGADPSIGTASMMEMTRMYGKLHTEGWKPRRTLVFCSWAAEEYGLVGSTEWVEEHVKTLLQRAVAYLNVDAGSIGNYAMYGRASPVLRSMMIEATKKVKDPHQEERSLYDTWRQKFPETPGDPNSGPRIKVLSAGSDFTPFIQAAAVPSTDHRFIPDPKNGPGVPLYHTLYETVPYTRMWDPQYKVARTITQVWAEMGRDLADSVLLPLSVTDYATALAKFIRNLKDKYDRKFKANGIQFSSLQSAGNNFTTAAEGFAERLEKLDKTDPLAMRIANDRLMLLERAFFDPAGLPYRPLYRHMLFAPGSRDTYAGSVFAGLADLMFNIDADPNVAARWQKVKPHYAVMVFTIQSAAQFLMDD